MAVSEWTPELHAELLALCEAASPGPWRADRNLGCKQVKANKAGEHRQAQWITEVCCTPGLTDETRDLANASLIAAARTALPAALAEIERLKAQVAAATPLINRMLELEARNQRRERLLRECLDLFIRDLEEVGDRHLPDESRLADRIYDELEVGR